MLSELQKIVGKDRATCDEGELYCYSFDSSYVRGKADYVVRPGNSEEVAEVVRLAALHGIPVVPRGSASGLTGGAVPVRGGIVLDLTGMNRIIEIDTDNMQVVAEPGIVHATLNRELAKHGFFFPPDPGSSEMCSLGGLISNGGSGLHSVKYGTVRDYVLDLEVVLPDGEIIHTGCKAPKSSAGYDLTRLFVGSEGTLGVITRARLRVCALPQAKAAIMATFDRLEAAGTAAVEILREGLTPAAMEIMDISAVRAVKRYRPGLDIPEAEAVLIFETDGCAESTAREASLIAAACRRCGGRAKVAEDDAEAEAIWAGRRLVSAALGRLSPGKVAIYEAEDIGVPVKEVPRLLRHIRRIGEKHGLDIVVFGHIGDGDLHTGMAIDILDETEWKKVHEAKEDIYEAVLALDGTISGEHGIGIIRADYMPRIYGKGHDLMKAIKKAVDPGNIMNPGKMGL